MVSSWTLKVGIIWDPLRDLHIYHIPGVGGFYDFLRSGYPQEHSCTSTVFKRFPSEISCYSNSGGVQDAYTRNSSFLLLGFVPFGMGL